MDTRVTFIVVWLCIYSVQASSEICAVREPVVEEITEGCYLGSSNESKTIDVGTCRLISCNDKSWIKQEGKSYNCCVVKQTQEIAVYCDDVDYKVTKIVTCKCEPCSYEEYHDDENNGYIDAPFYSRHSAKIYLRKLLFVFNPQNIPTIELYQQQGQLRELKSGACFVSVSVYEDLSLREPYRSDDIEITSYVKEIDDKSYIGKSTVRILHQGHACVPVFCDKLISIYVQRGGNERLYAGEHYLPVDGYITHTYNQEVEFESRDFGLALDCLHSNHFKPNTICRGPMYMASKSRDCYQVDYKTNSFQFKFAPFTKPAILNYAVNLSSYNNYLSWYPRITQQSPTRACFFKIRFDIQKTFDLRIYANSYLNDENGPSFGVYNVGPIPDPVISTFSPRAACIEYRCAGYTNDRYNEVYYNDTTVDVRFVTTSNNLNCTLREIKPGLNVTTISSPSGGIVGLRFVARAGDNYGPRYGVFVHDKDAETFCKAGYDRGSRVEQRMHPMINPMAYFDCI